MTYIGLFYARELVTLNKIIKPTLRQTYIGMLTLYRTAKIKKIFFSIISFISSESCIKAIKIVSKRDLMRIGMIKICTNFHHMFKLIFKT
jgi:hypothetical protein